MPKRLLPALLLLTGLACHNAPDLTEPPAPELRLEATVTYVPLEGGFYGLVTDDGARYLPLNLDDAFRRDGLRVRAEGTVADVATIQMWGTPVRLTAIARR